jgi:hypothetical protein
MPKKNKQKTSLGAALATTVAVMICAGFPPNRLPQISAASASLFQGRHSPCQPGLGGQVFSTGKEIELKILPSTADFVDEIRLVSPVERTIGTNLDVGKVIRLSPVHAGAELIFAIYVRDTGQTFRMGPGSRNPDRLAHANVTCLGDEIKIRFEDFLGGGDFDYDDAVFQLNINPTLKCDNQANSSSIVQDTPVVNSAVISPPLSEMEIQQLEDQLEAVMRFIITDQKGKQRLLREEALKAGISMEAVNIGQRLVKIFNRIAKAASNEEEASSSLTAEDFAFIDPLFRRFAKKGISPLSSENQSSVASNQLVIFPHCGSFISPTPCPPRMEAGVVFSSREDATQHLLSLGYHLVPRYATVPGGFKNDFALVIDNADCGSGPFRKEAALQHHGECWTFYTQGPEPNPEIFSYVALWPYPWWPEYVFWWHRFYC